MPTMLVKGLSEGVLKELKRLKVELNCRTWAELLARLAQSGGAVFLSNEDVERMKIGVNGLLRLRGEVSRRWPGRPSVLDELRKSRRHERG